MLATIVGGGIVGIPFSMEHSGIPLGLVLLTGFAFCAYYAAVLYFETKLLSPVRVNSLYEMSFVVLGKSSIYLVAGIVFLSSFGVVMIYFIVFRDICASIVT